MMAQQRVCVIGAGVIGLSCAVNIIETISNVDVTIVSHLFSPNTTSDVAAAIFGLKPLVFGDTSPSLQKNWFLTTSHHMESILKTQEASEAGVNVISGYYLHNEKNNDKKLPWRDIAHGSIRSMTNSELNLYPGYSNGLSFSMLMCETRKYLPWLMKRYKDHGGKVIKQHIGKLIEVSLFSFK
ncbi:D-aspartate oxidase-like [Saccoglossus kowalevskii]